MIQKVSAVDVNCKARELSGDSGSGRGSNSDGSSSHRKTFLREKGKQRECKNKAGFRKIINRK